jgi:hypothetical protein
MPTSDKKTAANRLNGRKTHGPKNTTSTRFNATKHGLLAVGITELDDVEGYRAILDSLREEKTPVGTVEALLVESLALEMVRLRRARRLEAEYITSELNPPVHEPDLLGDDLNLFQGAMLDPGLPAAISSESAQRLVSVFQRYESTFVSRMLRLLHELERLQRMRNGERLPAPAVVDVSVHASASRLPGALEKSVDTGMVDSAPVALEPTKSRALDVDLHSDTGIVDSVPDLLGDQKAYPAMRNKG